MTDSPKAIRLLLVDDEVGYLEVLSKRLTHRGFKVPTRTMPNFLVRFVALFDQNAKLLTGRLGMRKKLSNDRISQVLGWQPHSAEEMNVATAESLIEHGLIKPPA